LKSMGIRKRHFSRSIKVEESLGLSGGRREKARTAIRRAWGRKSGKVKGKGVFVPSGKQVPGQRCVGGDTINPKEKGKMSGWAFSGGEGGSCPREERKESSG